MKSKFVATMISGAILAAPLIAFQGNAGAAHAAVVSSGRVTISGKMFFDVNKNGKFDRGDRVASGRSVTLYTTAKTKKKVASVKTDKNGNYSIRAPKGVYEIYSPRLSTSKVTETIYSNKKISAKKSTVSNIRIVSVAKKKPVVVVNGNTPSASFDDLTNKTWIARVNSLRATSGRASLATNTCADSVAQEMAEKMSAQANALSSSQLKDFFPRLVQCSNDEFVVSEANFFMTSMGSDFYQAEDYNVNGIAAISRGYSSKKDAFVYITFVKR